MFKRVIYIPQEAVDGQHIVWESADGGSPDEIQVKSEDGEIIRYTRIRPGSFKHYMRSNVTKGDLWRFILAFYAGILFSLILSKLLT